MKIAKEVKIGVIVLLALLTLYAGLNYLKGLNSFSDNRKYYALYNNVEGLRTANPVLINGFRVGTVTAIEYLPENEGKLRVEFSVTEKNLIVFNDTKAILVSTDVLGSKAIELKIGNSAVPLENGETLKSEISASIFDNVEQVVKPLKEKTEHLLVSVDSLFTQLNVLIDADLTDNIKVSLNAMRSTFKNLEAVSNEAKELMGNESEKISGITQNLYNVSASFAKNTQNIESIIANAKSVSDTLAAANLALAVEETKNAMVQIGKMMSAINESDGTVGKLIHSDSLHQAMVSATNQLDLLLENFREYPNRYTNFSVFGRKEGIKLNSKEERKLKKLLKEQD